jgi:hypothetical protein
MMWVVNLKYLFGNTRYLNANRYMTTIMFVVSAKLLHKNNKCGGSKEDIYLCKETNPCGGGTHV